MKGGEIVGEFYGRKLLNSSSMCNSEAAEMLEGRRMLCQMGPKK